MVGCVVRLALLSTLLMPCSLLAQGAPPAPGGAPTPPAEAKTAPLDPWYSQLGAEAVALSSAVVIGKVESVSQLRGTDVVRVSISEWIWGGDPDKPAAEVTLLAGRDDFFVGTSQLLFLATFEKGPRFTVVNRIAKSDPDFEEKVAVLRSVVTLRRTEPDEERRRQARKFLYDLATARGKWTRWHAIQEIASVRKRHPDLVTAEDRAELKKLAARTEDADWKKALLAALEDPKQ